MISLDRVGPEALAAWKRDVDLGDHIGVEGEVISSRRGELSILADRYAITAKGLRPLPEKHRGLSDAESRVRHRYVDLIVNPDARRMAGIRAAVIQSIRSDLHQRGFLEVETPVLQTVHGGANARPFVTRINAYNMELFLRIALELHLKRLVVGGHREGLRDQRIFRNEGVELHPQSPVHDAGSVRGLRRLRQRRHPDPGTDPERGGGRVRGAGGAPGRAGV